MQKKKKMKIQMLFTIYKLLKKKKKNIYEEKNLKMEKILKMQKFLKMEKKFKNGKKI